MSSDSTGEAPIHPGPAKGLLLLVKVLGIILVLLFLGLIGGIIWKATNRTPLPAIEVDLDLGLDPASIRHLDLDGNMLAITTDKELLVLDVKQRKVLLRSVKP